MRLLFACLPFKVRSCVLSSPGQCTARCNQTYNLLLLLILSHHHQPYLAVVRITRDGVFILIWVLDVVPFLIGIELDNGYPLFPAYYHLGSYPPQLLGADTHHHQTPRTFPTIRPHHFPSRLHVLGGSCLLRIVGR